MIYDLHPYICLDPTCTRTDAEFETEEEWFDHHRQEHAIKWWCDGDGGSHVPECYAEQSQLLKHLEAEHKTPFTDSQLQAILRHAAQPSSTVFDHCPFCDFQPLSEAAVARQARGLVSTARHAIVGVSLPQTQLRTHICSHLVDLFVYALPDRDDIEEQKSASKSVGAARSEIQELDDVQLPASDEFGDEELKVDETVPEPDENIWSDVCDHIYLQKKDEFGSDDNDKAKQEFLAARTRESRFSSYFWGCLHPFLRC